MRNSFTVDRTYYESIEKLPENLQLEAYRSLMNFAFRGEIPEDVSPICKALITAFDIEHE